MPRLSEAGVEQALGTLAGWKREGEAIVKTFRFASFRESIAFVDRIAPMCDAVDHHPDILIRQRRVTLTYSTHSEGGLTEKDVAGAREAESQAAHALT
jgi:4a-hydroxytetrahydrobiopterin dehydratase